MRVIVLAGSREAEQDLGLKRAHAGNTATVLAYLLKICLGMLQVL